MLTRSRNCEAEVLGVVDFHFDRQPLWPRRKQPRRSCVNNPLELSPCLSSGVQTLCRSACAQTCFLDALPDDLVIQILAKVSAAASSPSDLISATLTCRRFCNLGKTRQVLSSCSRGAVAVKACGWRMESDRFLRLCADAGNAEACYMLGMIYFYCLEWRGEGVTLMEKAASLSSTNALMSLAAIRFNGSGRSRREKDLESGFTLCARAAALGHLDAIRELGHCWQDGYGVPANDSKGKRLLMVANALEKILSESGEAFPRLELFSNIFLRRAGHSDDANCQRIVDDSDEEAKPKTDEMNAAKVDSMQAIHVGILNELVSAINDICVSDATELSEGATQIGRFFRRPSLSLREVHPANLFLVDWFRLYPLEPRLKVCSQPNCGLPETRRHEFRRCSVCCLVHYCSRSCQALDWRLNHKQACVSPPPRHDIMGFLLVQDLYENL